MFACSTPVLLENILTIIIVVTLVVNNLRSRFEFLTAMAMKTAFLNLCLNRDAISILRIFSFCCLFLSSCLFVCDNVLYSLELRHYAVNAGTEVKLSLQMAVEACMDARRRGSHIIQTTVSQLAMMLSALRPGLFYC
jgi:hypothetical protein